MKKFLTITMLVIGAAYTRADEAAFQLTLTPDIAIQPRTTTIRGVSLGLWGENPQHSLTLGFVNGSTEESSGFSWALIGNYAESYHGVQWGFINVSSGKYVGWQDGFVNCSKGTFNGLQSGFVNYSKDFTGLQLGVCNYAEKLHGVQVGLVNVAGNNPWFSEFPDKLATGFPFFNWSF
jgi:hypothetical protein